MTTEGLIARLEAAGHDERLATGALYLEAAEIIRVIADHFGPPQEDCECFICDLQREHPL